MGTKNKKKGEVVIKVNSSQYLFVGNLFCSCKQKYLYFKIAFDEI